jgi:cytochrome c biogenesis protein CcmG, thiol:disulfide interchange protein DsbE
MNSNRTDTALKALIGVLVVVFAWVVVDTMRETVINVGDSAPSFTVTSETGKTISVKDFGGKLLVLNFWATWCPPCVEETPSLSEFAKTFGKEGVVVLAVSVDHSEKAYKDFLGRFRPAFETARDASSEIPASYGTFKYPETYIINREGKVVQKVISNRDWMDPDMVASIRRLL